MAGDSRRAVAKDIGILILRVGLGLMFAVQHGWDKITHPERWAGLGAAMGHIGIHFLPSFWGFMAAFSEFAGGICLVLGFLTRPMAGLIAFTMFIAATMHFAGGQGFSVAQTAIQDGILAVVLILTGAGRFSIDRRLFGGPRD